MRQKAQNSSTLGRGPGIAWLRHQRPESGLNRTKTKAGLRRDERKTGPSVAPGPSVWRTRQTIRRARPGSSCGLDAAACPRELPLLEAFLAEDRAALSGAEWNCCFLSARRARRLCFNALPAVPFAAPAAR